MLLDLCEVLCVLHISLEFRLCRRCVLGVGQEINLDLRLGAGRADNDLIAVVEDIYQNIGGRKPAVRLLAGGEVGISARGEVTDAGDFMPADSEDSPGGST